MKDGINNFIELLVKGDFFLIFLIIMMIVILSVIIYLIKLQINEKYYYDNEEDVDDDFIDKFYETVDKFIVWICHKFGIGESKELIKNFQEETHTFIAPVKQLEFEEEQKELDWDLER